MHRFIVEGTIGAIEGFTEDRLRAAAAAFREAQGMTGPDVQWIESLVTDGRIHCHYRAIDEEALREHLRRTGQPFERISKVYVRFDPAMAAAPATATA